MLFFVILFYILFDSHKQISNQQRRQAQHMQLRWRLADRRVRGNKHGDEGVYRRGDDTPVDRRRLREAQRRAHHVRGCRRPQLQGQNTH